MPFGISYFGTRIIGHSSAVTTRSARSASQGEPP